MKRVLCLAAAVVVFGCTNNPQWSRQGESSQRTAAALADCDSQARDATQRDTNIMNDIMATRGNDWRQSGVMSTQTSIFTAENQNRTGDIVNRCMISKGYVPGS